MKNFSGNSEQKRFMYVLLRSTLFVTVFSCSFQIISDTLAKVISLMSYAHFMSMKCNHHAQF